MIFSAEDLFSSDQVVTATAASTNILDLGAHGTVLGAPAALGYSNFSHIPLEVVATAVSGTSPTCTVTVQTDDNAGFASATNVGATYTLGATAGSRLALPILPEDINERYFRLFYTIGGTSPSFTITAGVVLGRQTNA